MGLDVLVAMILGIDSCDMTPCSLVVAYYHFEGTYCFRTDGAECSSETTVTCIKLHGLTSHDAV